MSLITSLEVYHASLEIANKYHGIFIDCLKGLIDEINERYPNLEYKGERVAATLDSFAGREYISFRKRKKSGDVYSGGKIMETFFHGDFKKLLASNPNITDDELIDFIIHACNLSKGDEEVNKNDN